MSSFLATIKDPISITTYIDSAALFPAMLADRVSKYRPHIDAFAALVRSSDSSDELLRAIRAVPNSQQRMALLKIFRRAVSVVSDTERTKKVRTISTDDLVRQFGPSFKKIDILRSEFSSLGEEHVYALAALLGEYDDRGSLGYLLVQDFFSWFKVKFRNLEIEGSESAGRDKQLSTFYKKAKGEFPFDFLIKEPGAALPLVVGFARYDSTRGGAQSDDRTQGNVAKVAKVRELAFEFGTRVKLLFLSDGPGLAHGDTWRAACELDGSWGDNVRVITLKIAARRLTLDWLKS